MKYTDMLEHSYRTATSEKCCAPGSKLEFLGEHIFEFVTYESEHIKTFTSAALMTCNAISQCKTFDFITHDNNHMWYLLMVNMPFFSGKIEWGTSIRGAWWNITPCRPITLESCGLYDGDSQILKMEFNEGEWDEFVYSMVEFVRDEVNTDALFKTL